MRVCTSNHNKKGNIDQSLQMGDTIAAHFADTSIMITYRSADKLDGEKFGILCVKEPDYVILITHTYI